MYQEKNAFSGKYMLRGPIYPSALLIEATSTGPFPAS
jgi:hypothetical protein